MRTTTGGSRTTAGKRKRHSPEFKAKVALELKTSHELAREYEVHPTQIAHWKRELREHAGEVFQARRSRGIGTGRPSWRRPTRRSGG